MTSTGTSYASYGCVDFAHNERTLAYYKWACANGMFPEGCRPEVFDLCFCDADSPDDAFVDPETDNVCWYDPATPESIEFLGLVVLNRPAKSSTFTREVNDGFIEGSILSRPTIKGREFLFDVLLIATSPEGMHYGEEWLRSVLEDAPCQACPSNGCQSCFGKRLKLRKHCPEGETTDTGIHEWYSVGTIDGLKEDDDMSKARACCEILKPMTFTMHSESPYSFAPEPIPLCDTDATSDGFVKCYDWSEPCYVEVVEDTRCLVDPLCDTGAAITFDPELVAESCTVCTPLAKVIQACCTDDLPASYDTTFAIDIYSGVNPADPDLLRRGMRDFRLKVYQNPKGLPCIEDEETLAMWANESPCIEFATTYIPYDATLTIDGRSERVTLTCGNVCKPYAFVLTDTNGSLFPLLTRCTPMMIVAEFSYYTSQLAPAAAGVKPSHVKVESYLRFRN